MKNAKHTVVKKTTKIATPKAYPHYSGPALQATPGEVWRREMPEFKTTTATCWLLINRVAMTYTFVNTYGSADNLKASYRPDKNTWAITPKNEKKLAAKIADMMEVPPTEWPAWITPAEHVAKPATRRGRKAAK